MKEVIVKDTAGFQLRVKKWECQSPRGLFSVHFVQATKDKEGKIDSESIYEFFMDQDDINSVAKALTE
jgi:hypothetical protein